MIPPATKANPATPDDPVLDKLALWEPYIHAFAALCPPSPTTGGALAGLTVGVKDIIDVAGCPTRNGSEACKDARPARQDAPVVAALRAGGARILGKTTTTEFAFTDPTPCRNPHDLARSPGGSSSGSGAAVAAGVVDLALGTQTAGSLCRPAAYCGVVGFKPGYGVLPTTGVTPLSPSFDSLGIIASSVGLAHRAFAVLSPEASAQPGVPLRRVVCGLWDTPVHAEEMALTALQEAAQACAALGLGLTQAALAADVAAIVQDHRTIMHHEAAMAHGAHGTMTQDLRAADLQPRFLAALRAGVLISQDQAAQAKGRLAEAKQAFWGAMQGVDMILTLPVPEGAPRIDGTTGFQDWLTPWTVFGGPLLSLPWGLDGLGRPRAVMLAGAPGQEHAVLSLAAQLEVSAPVIALPKPPGDVANPGMS